MDVMINFRTNQDEVSSSIQQTETKLETIQKKTRGHMSAAVHQYNEAQMKEIETRSKLALTLSAFASAMNIYLAVAGDTQNIMVSTILSVAQASLSMYAAYIALGAAANNWALVATGVAAIGTVASVINSMRALAKAQQDRIDQQSRMQQNMKI